MNKVLSPLKRFREMEIYSSLIKDDFSSMPFSFLKVKYKDIDAAYIYLKEVITILEGDRSN